MGRSAGLLVGIAAADITPPVGIILSGYRDRVSTSVGHPLRAEAMVCVSGRTHWALVTAETLGFSARFVGRLRRAVRRRTGIPVGNVMVAAVHTHSGPPTHRPRQRRGLREERYCTGLVGTLARLVDAARRAAAPAVLEATTARAPAWGHNRRVRGADGTWVNEWQDPRRRHAGYFDPTVLVVGVRRPDGRLDALLVNFGCHPVTLGPQSLAISGDYVSYLKDALERKGAARVAMFALSGHGNINPPVCIRRGARYPRAMGAALAGIVIGALPRLRPVLGSPLAAARVPWRVRCAGRRPAGKGPPATARGGRLRTELMALRAGGLAFVSFPGELFSEYSAAVRRASPFPHTVVLSLGNDYIGYLPTDRARAEGAYEATMAPARRLERPLLRLASRALRAVASRGTPHGAGQARHAEKG